MSQLINRLSSASGRFYPNNKDELWINLAQYFEKWPANLSNTSIQAIIVPHAGYIFSGEVAASAYALIEPKKIIENVFILAPSHGYYIQGASIYNVGNFETPLGVVAVNLELANKIIDANGVFKSLTEVHRHEHSIEVQLPFLQYQLKNKFQIVPILIGTDNEELLKQIATSLKPYFNERNLFIISSDFSHYPIYENARKSDFAMKEAIIANNVDQVNNVSNKIKKESIPNLATCACGIAAIKTLLYIIECNPEIKIQDIMYKNSGDSRWGDQKRVVGYWSFAVRNTTENKTTFNLNDQDKEDLLLLARKTIECKLSTNILFKSSSNNYSKNLLSPAGVFVTLHNKKELRGCIGRFDTDEPLYKMVQKMSIAAASQDYRFHPVSAEELNDLTIEISVLTPMKRIENKEDIVLGQHGIYIKKGNRHGTLLPQVAIENGWNVDEFLGYCSQNKTGLGWEGWKLAELYTYTAFVFSEAKS